MLRKNRALAPGGFRNSWKFLLAFARLCRLQLFSKLMKDKTVQRPVAKILSLMAKRPLLIPFAFYYAGTFLFRKLAPDRAHER
jgi:hypothetical protein